jgi:hypothetical protein
MPNWYFEADYLQGCSCDYGCPCEFEAPPTRGFCEGVGAWRIADGKFDQISLRGLGLAFAVRWPKAIHLGNGKARLFFDERATPEQREALLYIATGQAGGMPFEIIASTLSDVLEPQFVPFEFKLDGRNSAVKVGDAIEIGLTPIKNPVTGETEAVRIEHETGFIFKGADVVAAETCTSAVQDLSFSWPNKSGFVTKVRYSNQ